ncbi:neuraminidase-like domain-containing protein, partial [Pseudomonas resinovorans]
MAMQAALADIQEARRNALVDYYIAHCVPDTPIDGGVPLSKRVKTPDDLYEYLLIDTQITAAVTTARVAEAISSVQLYVNRCLGGYDPDVDNAPGSTMVRQSRPGGFLYDWDAYNQVYSTWAGKERLQYYPSVYLDPNLRYNKTELFNALEETINQGRINSTRVDAGFQQYMLGFEAVADLETISAYQAGFDITKDSKDTIYFIGRSLVEPFEYYWRSCDMAIRDEQGNITGGAWSQWLKVAVPSSEALNGYISPCWANGRLSVSWLSRADSGATGSDTNTTLTYQYYVNVWTLREDGGWAAKSKLLCTAQGVPERVVTVASENQKSLSVYLITSAGFYVYVNSVWGLVNFPAPAIDTVLRPEYLVPDKDVPNPEIIGREVTHSMAGGSMTAIVSQIYIQSGDVYLRYSAESQPKGVLLFYIQALAQDGTITYNTTAPDGLNQSVNLKNATSVRFGAMTGDGKDRYLGDLFSIFLELPVVFSDGFKFTKDAIFIKNGNEISWSILLSTSSAKYFIESLQTSIFNLLSYQTQTALIEQAGTQPIDFNGSYGLYFWEIFFHSSFLIADRYLNEQNYAEAAQWYRYIFAATGYRNDQGELETIDGLERYWNVVPLQQDHTWNTAIPPTDDPDVIAMNDPMHYKMAIFLNTVN